jgi:hypothetical protein
MCWAREGRPPKSFVVEYGSCTWATYNRFFIATPYNGHIPSICKNEKGVSTQYVTVCWFLVFYITAREG